MALRKALGHQHSNAPMALARGRPVQTYALLYRRGFANVRTVAACTEVRARCTRCFTYAVLTRVPLPICGAPMTRRISPSETAPWHRVPPRSGATAVSPTRRGRAAAKVGRLMAGPVARCLSLNDAPAQPPPVSPPTGAIPPNTGTGIWAPGSLSARGSPTPGAGRDPPAWS